VLASSLALLPVRAAAQTDWARADAAFRAGQWARAESLYARRAAQRGAPAAVRVNLATARALQGGVDSALVDLSRVSADEGRAGQAAGYNLGTLLAKKQDYDRALRELRRALERDPGDADARWNYEWVKQQQAREERKKRESSGKPDQPEPSPQQPAGSGQGQGQQPQQQGPQGAPQAPRPGEATPEPRPGQASGMSREQAERLLGSLRELERSERQRMRRGGTVQERRGKDW
jgi:Ca-activated chloride channel family protein